MCQSSSNYLLTSCSCAIIYILTTYWLFCMFLNFEGGIRCIYSTACCLHSILCLCNSFMLMDVTSSFFSSVQFSRSVVSNSLRPHESQHTRHPCPSPTPEFTQTHVHRVSDAIQPSHPLSSPSPPAPNPSQHQSLFQ